MEVANNQSLAPYFLVYHENSVYSYRNRCPHTGVNLDWNPHQFLDNNNDYIQCSTHGALFIIKNGKCLRGPCVGDQLQIVENYVDNGNIYLFL
ncbi:MAG: Rieske 2Fe-2S domain-containing protein [Proteobacteria bacterium]|nr:Rieske (2Fe-2S) protein [Pseudomonadota bacterium]NOG59807.1 Rieske 2Fe-2S domain-containing protein [Pseudomonadota bacterium]